MIEKQKKNNSFLMQGMILAVAGIITRIIGQKDRDFMPLRFLFTTLHCF